jgi:hypothetical protein
MIHAAGVVLNSVRRRTMQQPERSLVKLDLIEVPIRPELEFAENLWNATIVAQYCSEYFVFVCHRRWNIKLRLDMEKATLDGQGRVHMPFMAPISGPLTAFGWPVIFTDEKRSLFHFVKQCGANLNEPIVVVGVPDIWVRRCEEYPQARSFYVTYGPTIVPGEEVADAKNPTT